MHCSEYMEPRGDAVSVLLSSQKKQLRACCVFRKNVIVVKGSFLRATKSRMSQFEQRENVNFCQKLGHILPTHLTSQHAISFSFPV
jgi:hypothetical protein